MSNHWNVGGRRTGHAAKEGVSNEPLDLAILFLILHVYGDGPITMLAHGEYSSEICCCFSLELRSWRQVVFRTPISVPSFKFRVSFRQPKQAHDSPDQHLLLSGHLRILTLSPQAPTEPQNNSPQTLPHLPTDRQAQQSFHSANNRARCTKKCTKWNYFVRGERGDAAENGCL